MGKVKAAMEDQRAEEQEAYKRALEKLRRAEIIIDDCRDRLASAHARITDAIAELEG